MQRTMVTSVAEPKSGSQEVGTRSNLDLMEGEMFKGEGGNGLTLRKHFFYLSSLFQLSCVEVWVLSLSSFFLLQVFLKKMTHTP